MNQRQLSAENLLLFREKASKYAMYGVLIASASVVIATLLVSYYLVDAITLEGIILAQRSNIALWTVDAMPFLFAMWGQYASYRMAREADDFVQTRTQTLREALTKADFTSKAKSDFFAKMSHELRTPINGIIGMTDLVLDTKLTKEQRRHLDIIKSSASSLLTLINDLLDFSKIEAGKLELEEVEFDLRDCVEKSATLLAQQARAKGLVLTSLIRSDVPRRLLGDPGRLRQVIINLLGNAIKFTHAGEVVLGIKKLPDEAGNGVRLHVEVADTGVGISARDQTRLFQPYQQAGVSTSNRYGGTGLGLTISKELVEAMGGKIGVTSQEGKGSVFWFTAVFRQPAAVATAAPAPVSLRGLRVLVADGNIPARVTLVDQLKALGMEVQSIGNGNAALQMVRSAAGTDFRFDLVLADMFLPDLSGEQLGREIKSHPDARDTVLVILTSAGVRGDAQRLNQLGFAGYFGKPIPPEHLQDALTAVMATRGMDEAERSRAGLVTKHTLSGLRHKPSRLLLVEDSQVNREIMQKQLSRLGYSTDLAESGRAAVEAAAREDYGLILMDLHLPDISGVAAIEAIRALPSARGKTPVVVLTAGASDEEAARCRALAVAGLLTKPVDSGVLADVLKRHQITPLSAMLEPEPETKQPAEALPAATKPAPDARLVEIFVKEATQRLESLRDAMAFDDARRAAREAHTLKSSSAYFQAADMRAAAAQLEEMADKGQLGQARPVLEKLERAYARLHDSLTKKN